MKNYQKNAMINNMQFIFMFDQLLMGEQWQMHIWLIWKSYMEFEFAFQMQYTWFKLNVPQISTLHIMEQL